MAIENGYTDLATFKLWRIVEEPDTDDDSVIEDIITQASRAIDTHTGRTFYARTEARTFTTPRTAELVFDDDLLTVTTLTNGNGEEIEDTSYILLPNNVSPKYALVLIGTDGVAWELSTTTNSSLQAISLAGTWGWSAATPADIESACLILTDDTYQKRVAGEGEPGGLVTSDGVRILPAGFPNRVRDLLIPYRRVS